MWVARLEVWHRNSYVAEKTKHVSAGMASVYLNTYEDGGKTYLSRVALVYGPDAERLVGFFKTDKRLKVEEINGRQVFFTMPISNVFHPLLMDRSVFFLKPVIAEKGIEHWTVGAYRKQDLTRLYKKINALKPDAGAEWVSLKKERMDLFAQGAVQRLSPKQRWAFETACAHGYYTYPRTTDLQTLARRLKVPSTTLRIHLRKAEAKLMPALGQALY